MSAGYSFKILQPWFVYREVFLGLPILRNAITSDCFLPKLEAKTILYSLLFSSPRQKFY